MKIIIETIPHEQQRYDTVGDWKIHDNENPHDDILLEISVSKFPKDIFSSTLSTKQELLVAVHELIEAILCEFNYPRITSEQVDQFDMSHPELEDPGSDPRAPYYKQHRKAEVIEMLLATYLGVDWIQYNGRSERVHRVSASIWLGYDLKSNVPICHKRECKSKACFNPDHLYIGTISSNRRDSVVVGTHHHTRKTHCPQGHEYTPENTRVDIKGCRHCRRCNREYYKKHKKICP